MEQTNNDLGTGKIGKLLLQLAIPSIIAQLVNLLYNIVDRIFIGRMVNGQLAMAGIGIVTPIVVLITAFSALVGFGGSPVAAIKMGEKDNDGADKILSNSFTMCILIGIVLTIVCLVFKKPIIYAFGASDTIYPYAQDYLSIYIIGTIFVEIAISMNSFINTQGFAKIGMITVIIGAALNIILDPIFIFGLNMGVKGAALATIISQFVSAVFVLRFLFGNKSILKVRKEYLKLDKAVVKSVLSLGVSPFIMQATESIVLICLNNQLARYGGDLAVSAMTIMTSMMQFITMPLSGLVQGAQPIISYNYGAKDYDRVKSAFKLLFICCVTFAATVVALLVIFPSFFVNIFNGDKELVEITSWCMRIYFIGIPVFGVQIACQQTFIALGQAKISLFLALLRKMILLVPLIFILPVVLKGGLMSVLMAEPISDVTAGVITGTLFARFYKKEFCNEIAA